MTGTNASQTYGQAATMHVEVSGTGPVPTGSVILKSGTKTIGVANLVNGEVDVPIPAKILPVGTYPVTINYNGNATYGPSTGSATLTVTSVSPTVTGTPTTVDYGKATTMLVKVTAPRRHPDRDGHPDVGWRDARHQGPRQRPGDGADPGQEAAGRHPHGDDQLLRRRATSQPGDGHDDA